MRAELETDYVSHGYVIDVLEVLRLCCEGHNNEMQNLLRSQPSELTDIDLVGETFKFLQAIEFELDITCVDQASKALETLIEFVQGNVSKGNTISLINNKAVELLSRLIEKDVLGDGLSNVEQDRIRYSIAVLLSAMLEGNDDRVEERMLAVINLKQTLKIANNLYLAAVDKQHFASNLASEVFGGLKQGFTDVKGLGNAMGLEMGRGEEEDLSAEEKKQLQLGTGFALYLLVKDLHDFKQEQVVEDFDEDKAEEADIFSECLDPDALEYYNKYTAHVEIVNSQGELERVQFRFPTFCAYLSDDSKQKLLWGVDRDTPGAALYEFFSETVLLHAEMKHLEQLQSLRVWRVLMHNKSWATRSMFMFAVVTNIIVVFIDYIERDSTKLQACDPSNSTDCVPCFLYQETVEEGFQCNFMGLWHAPHRILNIIIDILGCFQILSAMTIFCLYALQSGPVRQDQHWRQNNGLSKEQAYERAKGSFWFALQFIAYSTFYLFLDLKLLFFCFELVATVLAISVSKYFYSVLLVDIAVRDADLQNVFRSVTEHGRSIMVTAFFGGIVTYFFSILALLTLQTEGDRTFYNEDDDVDFCQNLLQCTANVMTVGLRKSDIGEIMNDRRGEDPLFAWQLIYSFLFWALIIIILLNIIFGIIIDTFGELRTAHLAIKQNMENTCFICRSDRFILDVKGGGFNKHVKHEHNMWHYLFMIIHIREKDPNEHNGWEGYVASMLAKEDLSFFPQLDAISLAEFKAREREEHRRQVEVATNTQKTVENLQELVQAQSQTQEKLLEEVRDLQSSLQAPQEMQQRLETFMASIEARLGLAVERQGATLRDSGRR